MEQQMLALIINVALLVGVAQGLTWVELAIPRKRAEREKQREIAEEVEQRISKRIAAIGAKRNLFPEIHDPPLAASLPPLGDVLQPVSVPYLYPVSWMLQQPHA